MIKKTETIQVRLTNYGTIEVVSIPTRIYKDSYNVMRLSCIVPKVEETGARICKVYATDVDEEGNTIFTSQAHFLPQLREKDGSEKIIKINGFDYIIYEDRLPEEFCKDTGNITLNFAEGIIDGENEIVRNNVSGQLNLFISGDGYNYNGVKISNYDVVASRIDAIYKTSENALKVAQDAVDAVVQGEGTKVTLNGVLQPTWSADFAESERQKSKNLFDINDKILKTSSDVEYSISDDAITITTAGGFVGIKLVIPANTQVVISWEQGSEVKLYDEQVRGWLADIRNGGTYTNDTDEDLICAIVVYGEGTYSKLQVEKGSVATDYQPYNGAIVHEEQIADVEHIETLYDMDSNDTDINLGNKGGLLFIGADTTVATLVKDKNKHSHIRFTIRFYDDSRKLCFTVENATTTQTRCLFTICPDWKGSDWMCNGSIFIHPDGRITPYTCKAFYIPDMSYNENYDNNSNFYVSKIEGVNLCL